MSFSTARLLARVDRDIVGLRREAEVLAVALDAGRNVVLEGPPGTGKSTLLRAIGDEAGVGLAFVEGNAELTPARLVGAHDPSAVLKDGYQLSAFVDGPLLAAMRDGGLLYIEELNRVPEETLNVLITALAERELTVPRVGRVAAHPRFRLVAAMNPFDAVGTARVSQAISDRMCRIVLGYQDEPGERRIVEQVAGLDGWRAGFAVAVARATREEPDVSMGASVRGAIDLVLLLDGLQRLRAQPMPAYDSALDAALAALSGRIRVDEGAARTPERIVTELVDRLWRPPDDSSDPDSATPAPEPPATLPQGHKPGGRTDATDRAGRRTLSRDELGTTHPELQQVSPEVGQLDEAAFGELLRADPDEAVALLCDLAAATDPALRRHAIRLARRVFVRLGRGGRVRRQGVRSLVARAGGQGDVDLERTLDRTGGLRPRSADELVVSQWAAPRRTVCLLLDHSGSMRGDAVARAALAAASTVLATTARADCSVLAFAGSVRPLCTRIRPRSAAALVDDVLGLRGAGTTDLAGALRAAARELRAGASGERLVVLLSDCAATAGGDPLEALAGIDRLHVISPGGDGENREAAEGLARRGGGRLLRCESVAQLPAALTALLS